MVLGDGLLSPRLRLSLRHDGGDAEHGFGTEVRAGLGWTDARRGAAFSLTARTGDAWDLGLGWRLVAEEFSLRLEAVRRDSETVSSDNQVQVQMQGRW